jgi:hypothetical protein
MFRTCLRALTHSHRKTARPAGQKKRLRLAVEALEERNVPSTVQLGLNDPGSANLATSYAGVGFAENAVAYLSNDVNGAVDRTITDFSARIDWGDGTGWTTADLAPSTITSEPFLVKGSHVYNQIGTYSITVEAFGPDGSSLTQQTCIDEVIQMPSGLGGVVPPTAPRSLSPSAVSLGLNDPGSANLATSYAGVGFAENAVAILRGELNGQQDLNQGDYHAFINWGDSTAWTQADIAPTGDGTHVFLVKGSHVYQSTGTFHIVVYAVGADGTSLSQETCIDEVIQMPSGLGGQVPPTAPRSLSPAQVSLGLNDPGSANLATSYIGVGFVENVVANLSGELNGQQDRNIADFHAYINWGDSTDWFAADLAPAGPGGSTPFLVRGSHVYQTPGLYHIVVYAVGPDGTSLASETVIDEVLQNPIPTPAGSSFVIAQDSTLWEVNVALPGNHWAQISAGAFSSISATRNATGDPVVFAIVAADHSLWEYNPAFNPGGDVTSHWAEVSAGAFAAVSATRDAAGNPAAFTILADRTLWKYDPAIAPAAPVSSHWALVSPGAFASISATQDRTNAPAVYAIVAADHSLWLNDPALNPGAAPAAQWAEVSPGYFVSISATRNRSGDPVVYAIVAGGSLWVNDPALNPSGPFNSRWALVSPGVFTAISASRNGSGDPTVFATVGDGSLWLNDPALNPGGPPASRWEELSLSPFSAIGADDTGDVFGVLATDHSLWEFRHVGGWLGLSMPGGETAWAVSAP